MIFKYQIYCSPLNECLYYLELHSEHGVVVYGILQHLLQLSLLYQ